MGHDDQTPAWLAELLDTHGPALVLYARQWCNCPDDVVQQAFVELIARRQRPQHPLRWLYRVVRNGAISAAKRRRQRTRREIQAAVDEAWFDARIEAIDAGETAAALMTLSDELREVVVARIWGELSFAEIAQLTRTSLSTAQRRYEQGLQALQALLEKPCTTNDPKTRH